MRRTWRQIDGKLVEVTPGANIPKSAMVKSFDPFVSPIDGSVIRTSTDLANHNRKYKVSNDLDSLKEQTRKHQERMKTPYTGSREERRHALNETLRYYEHNPHLTHRR